MQIFSLILYIDFLFMVSFAVQKLFTWMKSHLFIFAFVVFALGVKSKKILTKSNVK